MPAPGKTKLIKFPLSRAGKDVKCPGYARGGMLKLRFDWYIREMVDFVDNPTKKTRVSIILWLFYFTLSIRRSKKTKNFPVVFNIMHTRQEDISNMAAPLLSRRFCTTTIGWLTKPRGFPWRVGVVAFSRQVCALWRQISPKLLSIHTTLSTLSKLGKMKDLCSLYFAVKRSLCKRHFYFPEICLRTSLCVFYAKKPFSWVNVYQIRPNLYAWLYF